jgi:hypothetical protein
MKHEERQGESSPPRPTSAECRWRRLLEEQTRSGQTLRAFAAHAGVPAGSLSWWKHELARRARPRGAGGGEAVAPFVRVRVLPDVPARLPAEAAAVAPRARFAPYEIVLGGGKRVRVPQEFDGGSLRVLLGILEEGTC